MPFIRFELDAMECVPDAATLAGVTEGQFGWGLAKAWRHCWRNRTDTVTTDHLAGLFSGDGVRVGLALERFGFAEDQGGGRFRIRGAQKYLRVSEARSNGGAKGGKKTQELRKSEANLKQTRSKPEAKVKPLQRAANSEQPAASNEEKPAGDKRPPDPRHAPLLKELLATYRRIRGEDYPWHQAVPRWVSGLLASGLDPPQLVAAYERALRSQFPTVATLEEFLQKLPHFRGTGPPAASKSPVAAESIDWNKPKNGSDPF